MCLPRRYPMKVLHTQWAMNTCSALLGRKDVSTIVRVDHAGWVAPGWREHRGNLRDGFPTPRLTHTPEVSRRVNGQRGEPLTGLQRPEASGAHRHSKANIVVPAVRAAPVAKGTPHVPVEVVERTAPQHTAYLLPGN
jgi:hypothetical protein